VPPRVKQRTRAPLRRTMSRNPSCLISCTQSGPDGGLLALDGRQGSTNPEGRAAERSCNNMTGWIARKMERWEPLKSEKRRPKCHRQEPVFRFAVGLCRYLQGGRRAEMPAINRSRGRAFGRSSSIPRGQACAQPDVLIRDNEIHR
jgi:hypothetical protein